MHCSSVPSSSSWNRCHCPLLSRSHRLNSWVLRRSSTNALGNHNPGTLCCCFLRTSHNLTEEHRKQRRRHPFDDLFQRFESSAHTTGFRNQIPDQEGGETPGSEGRREITVSRVVVPTDMRWVDLKAALGQRINIEGIVSSASVLARDRELVLPHVTVPDIRYIKWDELKRRGFKGVVFDKDNTLTAPYSLTLWPPLGSSMERCKAVFGDDIAVFSNSAGLLEYDHDGLKARALEGATGIKVLRHGLKKPAGTAEEIEKHFGCKSSELIMVGDRPFTDVVFGNRNGFLTILTEPLTLAGEPFIIRQVRKLEIAILSHRLSSGLKPISHSLLPDAKLCVRDPPPP